MPISSRVLAILAASICLLAAPAPAATVPVPPEKPPPPPLARPAPVIPPADSLAAGRYRACLALARGDPGNALAQAEAWSAEGGGEPAGHCAAVALIGLQRYPEAAGRLEALARAGVAVDPQRLRAGLFDQAAQAWLLADRADPAIADESEALLLLPADPDLLIDRAEAYAQAKEYAAAEADLDQALAGDPDRADALSYRAAARRLSGDLAGAAADAARAIQLAPSDPAAWLEAANTASQQGDADTARADWARVIQLAPDSAAAMAAHRNLGE